MIAKNVQISFGSNHSRFNHSHLGYIGQSWIVTGPRKSIVFGCPHFTDSSTLIRSGRRKAKRLKREVQLMPSLFTLLFSWWQSKSSTLDRLNIMVRWIPNIGLMPNLHQTIGTVTRQELGIPDKHAKFYQKNILPPSLGHDARTHRPNVTNLKVTNLPPSQHPQSLGFYSLMVCNSF